MSCNNCQLNNSNSLVGRVDMLTNYDWLSDLPDTTNQSNIVEVRFKGTRKDFYINDSMLPIKRGDAVVVSSTGGHDVGIVSLTGKIADLQFSRKIKAKDRYQCGVIYRIAKSHDMEKWQLAQDREKKVMIRARELATQLNLDMKIGDVEFRGDGAKAIFYYIADGRVDFRELIKVYASEFEIKVEMKQIGARQEAARIGGIGSCGRELCCSSWRTDFSSISANMATKQGLSPNAEKLTGRCGKLKCCLMYELDTYLEAQNDFPNELLELETANGIARHFKTDILERKIWYVYDRKTERRNFSLTIDQVKDVIQKNKRGQKPDVDKLSKSVKDSIDAEKNMFNQNLTSDQKLTEKQNPRTGQNRRKNNKQNSFRPKTK